MRALSFRFVERPLRAAKPHARRSMILGAGFSLFLFLFASNAAGADEATTLETQLGKETTELSTADCASACKALASIRRAADRICELEPGPRCDAARTKADDATKRVREACPECAVAQLRKPEDEKRAAQPVQTDSPQTAAGATEKSESRGGCRNCATSSGAPDHGDFAVFALAALALGRRLKKNRKRL